jgi:hypothetical protein
MRAREYAGVKPSSQHLVQMAHDIAANTRTGKTEAEAAGAIADHIQRFCTPNMRKQLLELCRDHPTEVGEEVLMAAQRLSEG